MTARSLLTRCSPPFLRRMIARVESSPLGGRLARGAFWSLAGSLISRGLGLFSAILVGRLLGKVEFGEFGIIQNTIGMFGVVAGFGMSVTANKHVAEFKNTNPARAGRILAMSAAVAWITSAAMAVVLCFSAPWVAERMLAAPHLTPLLRISSLLLFLSGINGAQGGALGGFEAFKPLARIALWTGFLSFPVTLGLAWSYGISGAVWALVIVQGANCLFTHLAVRQEMTRHGVRSSLAGVMQEAPLFWRFSLPAVMTGLVGNVATWGASVLVVNQAGGYADMGVFNAVMRVKAVPDILLSMLLLPILPVLSEAFGKNDMHTFQKALLSSSMLALVVIIPVSLFQSAAPDLTLMLYGADYQGHPAIVQWLMLHSVLNSLLYAMGSVLISTGSMWLAWTLSFVNAIVHLGTAWLLVPRYGAAGFAASLVIGYTVSNVPSVVILFRRLPGVMQSLRFGRIVALSLSLFGGCVLASLKLELVPAAGVGILAVCVCLVAKYRLFLMPRPVLVS